MSKQKEIQIVKMPHDQIIEKILMISTMEGYKPKTKPQKQTSELPPKEQVPIKKPQYQVQRFFGEDNRIPVQDQLQYPYSAIGLLTMKQKQHQMHGTAFFIGENILLTVAHNIAIQGTKIVFHDFKFFPAQSSKSFPIKRIIYSQQIHKQIEQNKHDIAIIELQDNIGQIYGYFGVSFKNDSVEEAHIYGYPGQIRNQSGMIKVEKGKMYGQKGKATINNQQIQHLIPTTYGQSGSPIYQMIGDKAIAIGIHVAFANNANVGKIFLIKDLDLSKSKVLNVPNLSLEDIIIKMNKMRNLQIINFSGRQLKQNEIRLLSQIKDCENLTDLTLSNCKIGNNGLSHLVKGKWNKLAILNLENNNIDQNGMSCIQQGIWPNLAYLNLSCNKIRSQGVLIIFQAKWKNLKSLNLQDNGIDAAGYNWFGMNKWPSLAELCLRKNKSDGIWLLDGENFPQLYKLDISKISRSYKIAEFILDGNWPKLHFLIISKQHFQQDQIKQLQKVYPALKFN